MKFNGGIMNLLLRIKLLAGMAALMLMPVALMAQERIAYNSFASGKPL